MATHTLDTACERAGRASSRVLQPPRRREPILHHPFRSVLWISVPVSVRHGCRSERRRRVDHSCRLTFSRARSYRTGVSLGSRSDPAAAAEPTGEPCPLGPPASRPPRGAPHRRDHRHNEGRLVQMRGWPMDGWLRVHQEHLRTKGRSPSGWAPGRGDEVFMRCDRMQNVALSLPYYC